MTDPTPPPPPSTAADSCQLLATPGTATQAVYLDLDHSDTPPPCILEATTSASRRRQRKATTPPGPLDRVPGHSHRVLGTTGTVVLAYFVSCGGPVGVEPIISAGGPLVGLSALVLYPLLVTVPYAWILTELCTAFPEDGGFVVWVLNAFGPFFAFQVGYWSWVGGVLNAALLPNLLLQLVLDHAQHSALSTAMDSALVAYAIKASVAIALSLPSFFGTRAVTRTSLTLLVLVLGPALVLTMWGYAVGHDYHDLSEVRREGSAIYDEDREDVVLSGEVAIDWGLLLNSLFWSYDGINMVSVIGGEVANPARVFRRAIAITVLLSIATYVVPMPAVIVTENPHWTEYTRDSLPFLAKSIGGATLEVIVVVGSFAGIAGAFLAGLFCRSIQLCGMADQALLPSACGVRATPKLGAAPVRALGATLAGTLMLLSVDFDTLLPVANALLCAVQLLILAAAIRLRLFLPFIPRPTRVPGGVLALGLLALPAAAVLAYIAFTAFRMAQTGALLGALLVPGILVGAYQQFRHDTAAPSPIMFA